MIEKIRKYREYEAVSYSKLSKMLQHPRNLIAEDKQESDALSHGSVVDCLMFSPEDYSELYYNTNVSKPGAEMGKWLDAYINYELPADFTLHDTDEIILAARRICGYNKRLGDDAALKKFHEECDAYNTELAKAGDRTVVSDDDYARAVAKQVKLINNEFTSPYFANSEFQVEGYFEFEDIKCKILLDGVLFDHWNKTIKPWDLKTTSESTLSFSREFLKWRYYIQAALYRVGLSKMYPDYKILPFEFIIVNDWEEPIIWGVPDELHSLLVNGGYLRSGYKIKGICELIEDYKWHEENQKYDYPKDFYTNGGIKWIDSI